MRNLRRNGGAVLDERDVRLIALLEANARASLAELARALSHLAAERQRTAEAAGGSSACSRLHRRARPEKLGLSIGAYIRIQPAMGELARVAEIVKTIPEIVECDRITGEDCFVAKVFVAKVEDLEGVIDRLIPYARTNTSIIQSSPVPRGCRDTPERAAIACLLVIAELDRQSVAQRLVVLRKRDGPAARIKSGHDDTGAWALSNRHRDPVPGVVHVALGVPHRLQPLRLRLRGRIPGADDDLGRPGRKLDLAPSRASTSRRRARRAPPSARCAPPSAETSTRPTVRPLPATA